MKLELLEIKTGKGLAWRVVIGENKPFFNILPHSKLGLSLPISLITCASLSQKPLTETRLCPNQIFCPVNFYWGNWSPWSSCTTTCGLSYKNRMRDCNNGRHGGKTCPMSRDKETKSCNKDVSLHFNSVVLMMSR